VKLRIEKSEDRNRMAEQKFLALFNVPLYSAFLYSKNRFVTLNNSFVSLTGYSVNELNRLTINDFLQDNKEAVLKEFRRCKSGFCDNSTVKFSFVNKDKQLIFAKLFMASVNLSSDLVVIGSMLPYKPDSGLAEGEHRTRNKLSELTQYFKDNNQSIAGEIETACKILDFTNEQEEEKIQNKVGLTPREKEVLQLICKGLTNKEISEKLFISPRTVDNHRASILLKTEVKNTAALVAFALKHDLV
jgi:DNA-binding CsgD family transcriptional regulator